jgi:hypothetical protein
MESFNLVGKTFGDLTVVLRITEQHQLGTTYWFCSCVCGRKSIVREDNLCNGNSTSCGCKRHKTRLERDTANKIKYRTGARYGLWHVLAYAGRDQRHFLFTCICQCGTMRVMRESILLNGRSHSCGCVPNLGLKKAAKLRKAALKKRLAAMPGMKVGLLVVKKRVSDIHEYDRVHDRWLCECECGGTKIVKGLLLRRASTKSCGCLIPSKRWV